MKSQKERYYIDHPCPSWADDKQWQKLLGKVTFSDEGISYEKLSAREVKILEGFTFSASLERRTIHKSERMEALDAEKNKAFSNGRKMGAKSKKTNQLIAYIQALYLSSPKKKAYALFIDADKSIIGRIQFKTFEGYLTEIKKQLRSK